MGGKLDLPSAFLLVAFINSQNPRGGDGSKETGSTDAGVQILGVKFWRYIGSAISS